VRAITAQDDPFVVSVDLDGTIFISESPVTREEFRIQPSAAPRRLGCPRHLRQGRPRATHGQVMWVKGMAQRRHVSGGRLFDVAEFEVQGERIREPARTSRGFGRDPSALADRTTLRP
jgi:hypothetical protein